MSELDDKHFHLFKGEWISDPSLLQTRIRGAKVSDTFTAELAAWCVEIHEHLRDLQGGLGVELMLMGGNGASLRFDAVAQRGSRDNDYLTSASRADIQRLMDALGTRFAALPEALMKPAVYKPKKPVRELEMTTYEVAVPLRLNHGNARDNRIKVEFHFENALPPAQKVVGALGPAASPEMTAQLPALPYQVVIKLMTLAGKPVGIDEATRLAAVPRQLYDLDGLAAGLTASDWPALIEYCASRYAHECGVAGVPVSPGEPFDSMGERLLKWADCLDSSSEQWRTIQTVQSSQLRRPAHRTERGWRARAHRLFVFSECIRRDRGGWALWEQAGQAAALVPDRKAKAFRPTLAGLARVDESALPLELHDFTWEAMATDRGDGTSLAERVEQAHARLSGD